MNYELWDVEIGKGLARFASAFEMANLVESLIHVNGKAYAVQLSMVIEEASGDQRGLLTGTDLLAWTWGVLHARPESIRVSS